MVVRREVQQTKEHQQDLSMLDRKEGWGEGGKGISNEYLLSGMGYWVSRSLRRGLVPGARMKGKTVV